MKLTKSELATYEKLKYKWKELSVEVGYIMFKKKKQFVLLCFAVMYFSFTRILF